MQVISSPQTSSREVAVAVAGVGELAPPTRRFFDQQVLAAYSHIHFVLVLVCAMLKEAFQENVWTRNASALVLWLHLVTPATCSIWIYSAKCLGTYGWICTCVVIAPCKCLMMSKISSLAVSSSEDSI